MTTIVLAQAAEPLSQTSHVSGFWALPFVALLACIALMPFVNKHWWEKNYPFVAVGLAVIPLLYYTMLAHDARHWLWGMSEYVSFIVLLGSLYVVSGGVMIHVSRRATPWTNVVFLLLGAAAANVFGTTGASMLLIRPFLRINKGHVKPYHVVFFIFVVSNAGGSLTPVGDPPLFLGYLHGVPFWWMLEHCWQPWALTVGLLLAVFFVIDHRDHKITERHAPNDAGTGVEILGIQNFLFIGLVIFGVFREGVFDILGRLGHERFTAQMFGHLFISREVIMLAAAFASYKLTPKVIHDRNEFSFGPIKEVAILFVGIFSTMIPALQWLEHNAKELPIRTPGHYYFASGALSSVLDNAPTYLSFMQAKLGSLDESQVRRVTDDARLISMNGRLEVSPALKGTEAGNAMMALIRYHPEELRNGLVSEEMVRVAFLLGDEKLRAFLIAVALGSVFFGACTYIGNGPNFMVKSIADSTGAKTPSFVEYVLWYSLPILIPIYTVVWFIFIRS